MLDEPREVAIDTDFFKKFTEMSEDSDLFMRVMNALRLKPVMHEYVYTYELFNNEKVKNLVDNGYIHIYKDEEYLPSDQSIYTTQFKMAYQYFNGEKFTGDVFTYQHAQENLGEIRTALMSLFLHMDILMTDDVEAKAYIERRISTRRNKIVVLDVVGVLSKVDELKNGGILWKDIKGFAKRVINNKSKRYKYIELREKWNPEN